MKYVYSALNWIFSVGFLITGLSVVFRIPLAGLSLLAISMLLLPPVRSFLYDRFNRRLPTSLRALSIITLLIVYGVLIIQHEYQEADRLAEQRAKYEAEEAAKRRQQKIDHFNANREKIISSVEFSLSSHGYQDALLESAEYLDIGDGKIVQLHALAKKRLADTEKAKKTEALIFELKTIPVKEFRRNRDLYKQLVALHPKNEKYKSKIEFYQNKVDEEDRQQIAAAARQKRIKDQFSSWDGSHYSLVRYVKKVMHDPGSYKHVETVFWDKGDYLIVKTTFRGKNAFGGLVRNAVMAEVSLDGEILDVIQ